MLFDDVDPEVAGKQCIDCEQFLIWENFRYHAGYKNKKMPRCISCDNYDRRKRYWWRKLHQQPDACQLCGIKTLTLEADHDHETGEFRQYLCRKCNRWTTARRRVPPGIPISSLADAVQYRKT